MFSRMETDTDGTSTGVVVTELLDTATAVRLPDCRAGVRVLLPASKAAWSKVNVAVHTMVAPTARVPLGLHTTPLLSCERMSGVAWMP